jgi:hypothetical protein
VGLFIAVRRTSEAQSAERCPARHVAQPFFTLNARGNSATNE